MYRNPMCPMYPMCPMCFNTDQNFFNIFSKNIKK
jgi:hypothetical protein